MIISLNIKKLEAEAVLPKKAHPADAGLDLTCTRREVDEYGNIVYHTDIAVEIPDGCVGLLFPRSSNCKKDLWLTNSVGVIDSNYRGEITFKYRPIDTYSNDYLEDDKCRINYNNKGHIYEAGDRVGQLVVIPIPDVIVNEVEKLTETDRGDGGYGSTGK